MIKNILIITSFICSLGSIAFLIYEKKQNKTYVFVDTMRLYSEFEYTKQSNKTLEGIVSARKNILDSLYETVKLKVENLKQKKNKTDEEINAVTRLQEEYFYKKEQFEKENQETISSYNSKIWNQINALVADFGKEFHYQIVFGANGQGNIMYGNPEDDKTRDAVDYLNKKFNGKN